MTEPAEKSVSVSIDYLRNAFEFVSSGSKFENEANISVATGDIYLVAAIAGINEMPDEAVESDDYIGVPHKNDLDLGRDLVFAFVDQHLPDESDAIRDIFRSRGAYRRFKHLVESRGMLDSWYTLEENTVETALREWCEEVGIRLRDAPKSGDAG
jgi:hypothetical protein